MVKYETRSCRTALKLRVRARNVGEMCAGEMDDLQGDDDAEKRWEEACRREEAIRDLLSRSPDGLKGRDVTDLAWELGSAALRPTERSDYSGPAATSDVPHGSNARPAQRLSYTRQGARRNRPTRRSTLFLESHLCSIFETRAAKTLMFNCSDDRKPPQSHV